MAILIVTLPLIVGVMAADPQPPKPKPNQFRENIKEQLACRRRNWALLRFLKGAETVEIKGKVVTHLKNKLVPTSGGESMTVYLPTVWNNGTGIVRLNQIYERENIKARAVVTIKVLKRSMKNERGVTISVIFGYELVTATGKHLTAVLPFNISK